MTILARCGKTRLTCLDMLAGARGELATGGLPAAERVRLTSAKSTPNTSCSRKLARSSGERRSSTSINAMEMCALEWREAFQHQHQRDGNDVGEIAGGVPK